MQKNLLSLFFLFTLPLCADMPTGMKILEGTGISGIVGKTFHVICSDDAKIQWDNFSIEEGGHVNFIQSGADAVVINRIEKGKPSEILGKISSNGTVILINTAGVHIKKGGKIESESFVASTFSEVNKNAQGKLEASGKPSEGKVENAGTIEALSGTILLAGGSVVQSGKLAAPLGSIELFSFGSKKSQKTPGAAIYNQGEILAQTIDLHTNESPYQIAIKTEGTIQAISSSEKKASINIVSENGWIQTNGILLASNEKASGGSININGEQIILHEKTEFNLNGALGGGSLSIGGDPLSKKPLSKITYAEKGVRITANATEKGNGGKISLTSEDATLVFCKIEARPIGVGGLPGILDITSKKTCADESEVDLGK